jgi:PKD repeat protein
MQRTITGLCRAAALVALASGAVACSIESQEAPALIGPSGFAQSVTLSASPDRLPRDGSSQSVITVTVRNESGQAVSGQRLSLGSTAGTLSQGEVVTGGDGRATFTLTAPSSNTPGSTVEVFATPIGANSDNGVTRSVSIAMTGIANSTAPSPSFTVDPAAPTLRQNVVFDASGTTDENARCGDACTYAWDFGGEGTASGRVVTYQFQSVRTYPVRLTVTDRAGTTATLTQNVSVSQGAAPIAAFNFSPQTPGQFEPVTFNAEAARPGVPGRTLTSYQWSFGDGTTGSGITTNHAYNGLGTYVVTLTVTDSAGVQGTTTQTVTVAGGVTAAFTFSPANPTPNDDILFDAEASQGSSTGFGGRNPIVEYIWNFGDPNSPDLVTTSSRIIQHRFTSARTYNVVLTVVDSAGRRATTTRAVNVQ